MQSVLVRQTNHVFIHTHRLRSFPTPDTDCFTAPQSPLASSDGPKTHRASGTPTAGHGDAAQPSTLRQGTPTSGPATETTGTSEADNAAKTPQPRQTYPLPMDEGGRGTSAWARGGGEDPLSGEGGVPPGVAGGVGEEESAPGRRRKKESRVDSPLAAAARAAAVYELPALRETAATKRRSHQVSCFSNTYMCLGGTDYIGCVAMMATP